MDEPGFSVTLTRESLFRFLADFGLPGVEPLAIDEPPPIGEGAGPNASRLLAASVGACLAASALYCLEKARVPVGDVAATVDVELERNERGRLRIGRLVVRLGIQAAPENQERTRRCLDLFEDFCVVTQSVRAGVPVEVAVETNSLVESVPR